MIIGIHGKKEHGKDLLCKIIQSITNGDRPEKIVEIVTKDWLGSEHKFKKRMFAEKLKQIICLLIGCTMEDLENQEFKETPLGPEWDKYYLHNITYELWHTREIFNTEQEAWNRVAKWKSYPNQEAMAWVSPMEDIKIEVVRKQTTPRSLLQLIGTECGRNIVHPNIWVNALMSDYKPTLTKPKESLFRFAEGWITERTYRSKVTVSDTEIIQTGDPKYFEEEYPNWLVTDVRFRNECQAIKDRGGLLFKIFRPGMKDDNIHESETALDNVPIEQWDGYVLNNGSDTSYIEVVINQIRPILKIHKII